MTVHPKYIIRDPSAPEEIASSIPVLRASDTEKFLASKIPKILTKDAKAETVNTDLAGAILPTAATPILRISNHPNIISLVDIVHTSSLYGSTSLSGDLADLTVWEDMDAGSLSYLLPNSSQLPEFADEQSWHVIASQNFQRFPSPNPCAGTSSAPSLVPCYGSITELKKLKEFQGYGCHMMRTGIRF